MNQVGYDGDMPGYVTDRWQPRAINTGYRRFDRIVGWLATVSGSKDPHAMDKSRRRELARQALDGYVSGPNAPIQATAMALEKATDCRAVVLVEGISDQIALEALAVRQGRDFEGEGVVIVPVGGAQGIEKYLDRFGPNGADVVIGGLCDAGEEAVIRRRLEKAGFGAPASRTDLEALGFFVCVEDLEDELIRAVGTAAVEILLDSQGDLGSFRTLQRQPDWRTEPVDAQLRRFFGSGARRKLRYARLLVQSVDLDKAPYPLEAALSHVESPRPA